MSLTLYYAAGACSFVPHALLEASGAAYEPVVVKLHKQEQYGDAYRAINPRSQVPVLVTDGQVITQIVAIVDHLDQCLPQCGFIPREPLARARVMETLAWMNNTVHPTFTHIFMPHKFTDQPEAQAELKRFNTGVYRQLLGEIEAMASAAAARGDVWLGGTAFGPLDPYALTLLRWGTIAGIDPAGYPALWAQVQKTAQHAPVQRAMERERLQLSLYRPA